MLRKIFTICFVLVSTISTAQSLEYAFKNIKENVLKSQLDFISSDWMEGRGTGAKGGFLAADYIASMFELYGIQPGGDLKIEYKNRESSEYKSYFQDFSLVEYTAGDKQELSVINTQNNVARNFNYKTDFDLRAGNVGFEAQSEIVFVGYGFTSKENDYDDFENVDVKGKIILRLDGFPGHKDTTSEGYKKFFPKEKYGLYYLNRDKNDRASELGAIAVIDIPMEDEIALDWANNDEFRFNKKYYEGDKPLASTYDKSVRLPGEKINNSLTNITVTKRVLNSILGNTEIDFESFEKEVANKLEPISKKIKNAEVKIKTSVDSRIIKARNVIGQIEGKNPNEYVIIGAHYDHLGKHDGYIWNGADDNGSGTVGMMTVAKACMETGIKPEKTIIFCAWTAEEKGMIGSRYFADNFDNINNVSVYLNLDMISRDSKDDENKNQCYLTYSKGFEELIEITNKNIEERNLNLDLIVTSREHPSGGSDFSSFSAHKVPIYSFISSFHDDYHKPYDHSDLCNIEKLTNLTRLGFLNIWHFANKPGLIEEVK